MALTRDYKHSVKERVERDPDFTVALLKEAVAAMLISESEAVRFARNRGLELDLSLIHI